MTLYTQADSNKRKTWFFLLLYVVLIILVGGAISWYYQSPAFLLIAAIISIVQGYVSIEFADSIALAAAKAQPLDAKEFPQVYRIVQNLAISAGLPTPRLYLIDDTAINAFATGKDPKKAAIAVTRGAIERLDDNELTGVLAHELSHVGDNDIRLMGMVMVMAGLIALISDFFLRSMFWGRASNDENDRGGGAMFLVALVLAILAPIAAALIQLAISRKREFLADAQGVLLTRYPEGLINALRKIEADEEPLEVANKGTAHMYIANPLHERVWLANLFSTHPPIEKRIEALQKGSGMAS